MDMKETKQEFWMCLVSHSGPPRKRYYSYDSAVNEATRLAQITGRHVYILHADEVVRTAGYPVTKNKTAPAG